MKYKVLIYYSNLALSSEDNDFVSNFLEQGSKIIEEEINQSSQKRYELSVDYLHGQRRGRSAAVVQKNGYL